MESICTEVKPTCGKSFFIVAWYKPPKYETQTVIEIETLLNALDNENKEITLIGEIKECVLIYISMSIIKKVFHYEETELPVIKCKDDIWFRGKTVAEILKYANQRKAIRDYVGPEDRARFDELHGGGGGGGGTNR